MVVLKQFNVRECLTLARMLFFHFFYALAITLYVVRINMSYRTTFLQAEALSPPQEGHLNFVYYKQLPKSRTSTSVTFHALD